MNLNIYLILGKYTAVFYYRNSLNETFVYNFNFEVIKFKSDELIIINADKSVDDLINDYDKAVDAMLSKLSQIDRSTILDSDKIVQSEKLYSKIGSFNITQATLHKGLNYSIGRSYRESLIHIIQFKEQLHKFGVTIAPGDNKKEKDHEFGVQLGVKTSKHYGDNYTIDNLLLYKNTIIKPYKGCSDFGVIWYKGDNYL
ncbi:hypothetical protein BZ13_849 [Francisella philomiragia subsp. philomiragia ATCC 25015]|uniref:hypothetical protein n=1 Tax=Francisella philomiragia TaxID=28110 RepID=UPI000554E02A|nr:hypothetical protein [Francisella philomiragia]AJI75773.1 hypothetical protein BZ13_849 [Francisella philomiragia subsp. philomiragia ATCC 25015]MBK2238181.1 hypothetical protein [Francisella philomiragia]